MKNWNLITTVLLVVTSMGWIVTSQGGLVHQLVGFTLTFMAAMLFVWKNTKAQKFIKSFQ